MKISSTPSSSLLGLARMSWSSSYYQLESVQYAEALNLHAKMTCLRDSSHQLISTPSMQNKCQEFRRPLKHRRFDGRPTERCDSLASCGTRRQITPSGVQSKEGTFRALKISERDDVREPNIRFCPKKISFKQTKSVWMARLVETFHPHRGSLACLPPLLLGRLTAFNTSAPER